VFPVSAAALGLTFAISVRLAHAQEKKAVVVPIVFQGAGPTSDSIQSTVDACRSALSDPNNNNPGPLDNGRREINWDGGGVDTTTPPITPFNVFLNTRGAQFTTPGTGLSQAPPSGGAQGGLAALFNNPTYGAIFSTFSPFHTGWQQHHQGFVLRTGNQRGRRSHGHGIRCGLHGR
jgi:hypothetical protein